MKQTEQQPSVYVTTASYPGTVVPLLSNPTTIGRDAACDICLLDTQSSRCHAHILRSPEGYFIEDLGSTNGTRVNGVRIRNQPLYTGDTILIGSSRLEVRGLPARPAFRPDPDAGDASGGFVVNTRNLMAQWSDQESGDDPSSAQSSLEALYRVGQIINTFSNTDDLFPGILDILFQELPAVDRASIHLLEVDTGELRCRAAKSRLPGEDGEPIFSSSLAESAISEGIAVLTFDALQDQRFKDEESICLQQIRSAACAPLQTPDHMVGVLYADSLSDSLQLSRLDLKFIAAIGIQAAVAIDNAQLIEHLACEKAALHRAHEELKAAHDVLLKSEKLAVVGKLSSGIVHEMKNPIAVIQLSNEMLRSHLTEKPGTPPPLDAIAELAGNIAAGVDQCRQVLDRLATYTRDLKGKPAPAEVSSLVQDVLEFLRYEIMQAGVTVSYDESDALPRVEVVTSQIRQVFINITLNAIQAMDKADKLLEISTSTMDRDQEEFVAIRFRDNGAGIPHQDLERIFEPFFSLRKTGQDGSNRTGLGMSVSHGIIKLHRGHILIDSAPGEGTTVEILIPVAESAIPDDPGATQLIHLPAVL